MADKEGVIIKGVAGVYTVRAEGGHYTCTARGVFRNRDIVPMVGDEVNFAATGIDEKSGENIGTIHTIKPRRNALRRPAAANIDQVIITMAAAQPAFQPGLLDRFLVLAAFEGIETVICINKADLDKSRAVYEPYQQAGYILVFTSLKTGAGLDELRSLMAGKLNVFAGPSGVGKSSLINAICAEARQETGDISAKLKRGKHTTRHAEILQLKNEEDAGYCVDTPGFSSLETGDIPRRAMPRLFKEFTPFLDGCRFSDCMHDREKDCAVKAQVGVGIARSRYESYLKMIAL